MKILKKYLLLFIILIIWQILSNMDIIKSYLLPSPIGIIKAFFIDYKTLLEHAKYTILEATIGLLLGISIAFLFSIIMYLNKFLYENLYPIFVISQTIPIIAIAPIILLWFGYGILPKVILVILSVFFPILISLINSFKNIDENYLMILEAFGANLYNKFKYLIIPISIPNFFSSLKISVSYSIISAVIAEWLGGFNGLGVYMIRVKKEYAFDKLFASIIFVSFISFIYLLIVKKIEDKVLKKYLSFQEINL